MGSGKRSGLVDGMEKTMSSECNVGLGLKMELNESPYSCPLDRRTIVTPHHLLAASEDTGFFPGFSGNGGGSFGGSIFSNTSNQVTSSSDIFEASVGGGMPVSGKALFTFSQWQELERQTTIYKHMMASVPVPSELLLPFTKNPPHAPVSQSNASTLDLRFSNGSDPEPWRCRRTDGKKWRCSRDVAPDQKYCERHAHKSRPRSRKHVEMHPQNSTNNYSQHPPILPANTNTQTLQKPTSQFPTMDSATSCDQTRCIEWFMRGDSGSIPVSNCNQQWQQLMQSSSRVALNRDNNDHHKNISYFEQQYKDKQVLMDLNSYVDSVNYQLNGPCNNSFFGHKMASLQGSLDADTTQITRHFIDAWSTTEKGELDDINNRGSFSLSGSKLPLSSLTLSMSGGNMIDDDNEHAQVGREMLESEKGSDGILKSQWLNPVGWMSSTPGGPLGEALCLGSANASKGAPNLSSPRGYSNSTSTSGCSKSSS